jgi:hypothetical protein
MTDLSHSHLQCGRYRLPIGGAAFRPLVMGVLNMTPDSFSDGGQFAALDGAISHAERMLADGVDIIDIGGESTRPGAPPLSVEEELRRIMPVIYALRDCGKPLSVDTRRPLVMREALAAGADMINDIEGFRDPDSLAAVSDSDCALCIMHMKGDPQTMQHAPHNDDLFAEVSDFLRERAAEREFTTVLGRAFPVETGIPYDGRSLVRLMEGQPRITEPEFYITECTWMRKHGWRTPQWKYIHALEPDFHFFPEVELYDLIRDPEENHNIAAQEPEVCRMLEARMQAHIAKREKETGRTNPIYTNLDWHGKGCGPFKTSQQAYDAAYIGSVASAQKLQAANKPDTNVKEQQTQRGAKL